ncbi:DUF4144 domain-containing protein [Colwellia sp. E2M01]|uniref:DUF4144 domain-containing protein n=1 Tax=Colwellia sp. E2M01 TaxID=2841561 RepID=UPI0020907CBE|nr:DUF4144 domain-containing protein [Colwellia sp. E2M01]
MFKLEGDNELLYVDTKQAFTLQYTDLILTEGDCLIDSMGQSFSVTNGSVTGCSEIDNSITNSLTINNVNLIKQTRIFTVEEVTHLIRAHEFSKAELCLTKIHFLNIRDAINSLCIDNKEI